MDSLTQLLDEAIITLNNKPLRNDIAYTIRVLEIVKGRLHSDDTQRAARLLYQEMDQWATIDSGTVRPDVIIELLRQEGLLRGPSEQVSEEASSG